MFHIIHIIISTSLLSVHKVKAAQFRSHKFHNTEPMIHQKLQMGSEPSGAMGKCLHKGVLVEYISIHYKSISDNPDAIKRQVCYNRYTRSILKIATCFFLKMWYPLPICSGLVTSFFYLWGKYIFSWLMRKLIWVKFIQPWYTAARRQHHIMYYQGSTLLLTPTQVFYVASKTPYN